MRSRFYQFVFAKFVKYVIYAFECKPNTIGEFIKGISFTEFRNPYKVFIFG
jgi:hypothetical protein